MFKILVWFIKYKAPENYIRLLFVMAYSWQKFYHYFWVSAKETELIQQSELDCFVNKTFFVLLCQFQFENRKPFLPVK